MIRRIPYANQLAISDEYINDQQAAMIDLSTAIAGILGPTTEVDGFNCTPTSPPSMSVNLAPVTLYSNQNINSTDYGTPPTYIPADTTHQILKHAYVLDQTVLTFVAPTTASFSRNDLIQISFSETDGNNLNLPFWNGIDPATGQPYPPFFQNLPSQRIDSVVIQVKPGTPAPTGIQVTPTPDAGFTGCWVITTTTGVPTITSGNIAMYPNAPFIIDKLKDKMGIAAADLRYARPSQIQANQFTYATDTGTLDALVATLSPPLTSYVTGSGLIINPLNTNDGPATINVNSLGVQNILNPEGDPLTPGSLLAGQPAILVYTGSAYRLLNTYDTANRIIIGSTYMSASQTVATGAFTKINFDTVEFDPYSMWDGTNKRFVTPWTGYWRITSFVLINTSGASGGGHMPYSIFKNGTGTEYKRICEMEASTGNYTNGGSYTFLANAGDYFEMWGKGTASPGVVYNSDGGAGTPAWTAFQFEFVGY